MCVCKDLLGQYVLESRVPLKLVEMHMERLDGVPSLKVTLLITGTSIMAPSMV